MVNPQGRVRDFRINGVLPLVNLITGQVSGYDDSEMKHLLAVLVCGYNDVYTRHSPTCIPDTCPLCFLPF